MASYKADARAGALRSLSLAFCKRSTGIVKCVFVLCTMRCFASFLLMLHHFVRADVGGSEGDSINDHSCWRRAESFLQFLKLHHYDAISIHFSTVEFHYSIHCVRMCCVHTLATQILTFNLLFFVPWFAAWSFIRRHNAWCESIVFGFRAAGSAKSGEDFPKCYIYFPGEKDYLFRPYERKFSEQNTEHHSNLIHFFHAAHFRIQFLIECFR